jgi:predicted HTH domain antitoxin
MALNVMLDLPADLEQRLCQESANISDDVKHAYLLELYRRGKINLPELGKALGLDRFDTEAFLQQNKVYEGSLTLEDLESDFQTLQDVMRKAGR